MLPSTIDSTVLCGYDSYELPLRDDAPPTSRGGAESHHCPATSPLSLKRRRRVDSCSSSCSTSLTSCGIHLSSLSLSSMSSIDTNHSAGIHELDGSDHSTNSNHHLRHHNHNYHDNDDYHHYQNSTDDDGDDDSPALGRLSKRHRAYTNLSKLCGSSTSSLDRLQDTIDACHIISGDHHYGNNGDDNEWGYFVDTI